jgi:hypothetical protein
VIEIEQWQRRCVLYLFIYTHWEVTKRGMQSCTIITGYSGKSRHWPSTNITRLPTFTHSSAPKGKGVVPIFHFIYLYFFHFNSVAILVQCIRLDQDCLKEKHHDDFTNSLGHSEICFEEKMYTSYTIRDCNLLDFINPNSCRRT